MGRHGVTDAGGCELLPVHTCEESERFARNLRGGLKYAVTRLTLSPMLPRSSPRRSPVSRLPLATIVAGGLALMGPSAVHASTVAAAAASEVEIFVSAT